MALDQIPLSVKSEGGEGSVMMEEMYRRLKAEFDARKDEELQPGMMLEDWEVEGEEAGGMLEGEGPVEKVKEFEEKVEKVDRGEDLNSILLEDLELMEAE